MEVLTDWCVATAEPSGLGQGWIIVASHFAPRLRSRHRRAFELAARRTRLGDELLSRDLPGVDPDESLCSDGLAAVGTAVHPGDVLVGRLSPAAPWTASPEEKLLRAIFGDSAGGMRGSSLRAPPGVEGVVVESALVPSKKGELARARVVVEWERPLAVGDLLAIEQGGTASVCAIRPLAADVQLDGAGPELRLAKQRLSRDVIHARSIGPYSLVTQQPLGGRESFGGQLIDEVQARALLAGGGDCLLGEMLTIKADAVAARIRAFESLVKQEEPEIYAQAEYRDEGRAEPLSGASDIFRFFEPPCESDGCVLVEAARVMQAELAALGFDVDWRSGQARAGWMGDAGVRERSRGQVTKPETIDYQSLKPVPGGLFCSRIFGPVHDYECACGKYQRMRHRGVVCEDCGVEVTGSRVRRERFGHLELAAPVLHPWCAEEVGLLLGREPEELAEIARGRAPLGGDTGGRALEAALAELDLETIARERGPRAELASAMRGQGLLATSFLLHALPVLPPDLRPLVPLDGSRFATSDLNDLYQQVINRNLRCQKLRELEAPGEILLAEIGGLQAAIAALLHNERLDRPEEGPDGRALRSLLGTLESRRESGLLSKRVDYSGKAMRALDPTLEPGCFRLPADMARELFKPMTYGRLEAEGYSSTIKGAKEMLEARRPEALAAVEAVSRDYPALLVAGARVLARRIRLWDHPAIGVDARTAEALGEGPELAVHIPLTEEAQAECALLEDCPEARPAEVSGWLAAMLRPGGDTRRLLARAAFLGQIDPLADRLLRAALGLPPP
ncbi:MAG: hypothetical protein JXR96_23915 [Deltaproteobacteria bacterium]|nr:hypothetical protein [Deltaproteobacteria bacterium]